MSNYNNTTPPETATSEDNFAMVDQEDIPGENKPVLASIQGYEGSFHQVAAQHFFGKKTSVICCATFGEVVKQVTNKKESDGGVMAIENSIAGSILPNYNLLQKSKLKVIGEIYLQIKQNLLVNPGIQLEDIKEVHSHPMAIQQCLEYLEKYNWKLVETEDTALSAKHIHQHKSKHIAAIASTLAARLYNLDVLAPDIHTLTNNYTRFLILQHEDLAQVIENANKASVNFHTDHSMGSLAKVLTKIAEGGINLSKLQSSPIPGSDFRYSFHADMEFDSLGRFYQVIKEMKALTEDLKIYGVYRKGKHYS
ncbi:prephenate dehydratase [Agriterribacter humi]|jgi:prephenate dehydratase|uniref:prephenate dehydratase n=1 Tax=Agriterribacter humi TaxID=1104781 RepID=UPI001D02C23F|nr:prephenate dehydratase [Agriterribacter humi]